MTLVDEIARAIDDTIDAADGVARRPDVARAALSVILRKMDEPSEELVELFVEFRDDGFGWKEFYPALAAHLREEEPTITVKPTPHRNSA